MIQACEVTIIKSYFVFFISNVLFKLRYAENHSVHGLVLVSACVTDLGDANEKASGKKVCLLSLQKWPLLSLHLICVSLLV